MLSGIFCGKHFSLSIASDTWKTTKRLQLMLFLVASIVNCVWADADRIIEQFNIVVDKLASDPQRAVIYKVTLIT